MGEALLLPAGVHLGALIVVMGGHGSGGPKEAGENHTPDHGYPARR